MILALTAGCSSQVRNDAAAPYKAPGAGETSIQTVAVLPFLLPDYVEPDMVDNGGSSLSIDVTNEFMLRLSSLGAYTIMDGRQVGPVLKAHSGTERDWLFRGDEQTAAAIGRDLGVEGVFFCRIKRYITSNLVDSEVCLEAVLLDCASGGIVYRVQSHMTGKQGNTRLKQAPTVPSAEVLAHEAVMDLSAQISGLTGTKRIVHRHHTVSPRRIAGYSLLGAGAAAAGVSVYYYTEANKSYDEYRHTDDSQKLQDLKDTTEANDKVWQGLGLVSLGCLGTSAYLLLTDHSGGAADEGKPPRYSIFVGPYDDGAMLLLLFRFR